MQILLTSILKFQVTFEYVPTPLSVGGVGMYIDSELRYTVLEKSSNEAFQALWVEIHQTKAANITPPPNRYPLRSVMKRCHMLCSYL